MPIAEFTPGEPNALAIAFFLLFVGVALGITFWAVRRTKRAPRASSASPASSHCPASTG